MVRRAKSLFITLYVVALVAGTAYAAMGWNAGGGAAWFGALVTWAAPAAALTTLVLLRRPRSSAHLPLVLAAVASGLVLALVAGSAATDVRAIVVAVTGAASFAAYNFWYSRFGRLPSPSLKPGAVLPAFELVSADGRTIDSAAFAGRPWLLLFHHAGFVPRGPCRTTDLCRSLAVGSPLLLCGWSPHSPRPRGSSPMSLHGVCPQLRSQNAQSIRGRLVTSPR